MVESCIRLRGEGDEIGGRIELGVRREFLMAIYGRDSEGDGVGVGMGMLEKGMGNRTMTT